MDNFLFERINSADLTKGQAKIAEYLLENQYLICQKSLLEVSQEIGVSDASVLRFVRSIGFDGYSNFKDQVYAHLMNQAGVNIEREPAALVDRLDEASSLRGSDLFTNFLTTSANILEMTLRQNDLALYQKVADKIYQADTVYIFGNRGTRSIAESFSYGLQFIKPCTVLLRYANDVYSAFESAPKNAVFIFLCASRYYKADLQICAAAKEAGIPTCILTNTLVSPISRNADHLLHIKTKHISYFNSNIGMMAVCEYLATLVCQKDEPAAKARLKKIDMHTEDERIM